MRKKHGQWDVARQAKKEEFKERRHQNIFVEILIEDHLKESRERERAKVHWTIQVEMGLTCQSSASVWVCRLLAAQRNLRGRCKKNHTNEIIYWSQRIRGHKFYSTRSNHIKTGFASASITCCWGNLINISSVSSWSIFLLNIKYDQSIKSKTCAIYYYNCWEGGRTDLLIVAPLHAGAKTNRLFLFKRSYSIEMCF